MGSQFGHCGTKPPTAFVVACEQAMNLQRGRQAIGGGPGQAGSLAQFG